MSARITDYLQLGANIGILAGLVLVGLQIRDANRSTVAQFGFESFGGSMVSYEIMAGEELAASWTKAQLNADDLTARDVTVIDAFLSREWVNNARLSRVAKVGYDVEINFETLRLTRDKWIFQNLGNDTALRWWRVTGERLRPANPELYDAINARLADLEDTHRSYHRRRLEQLLGD